jgi:hypothetical protein
MTRCSYLNAINSTASEGRFAVPEAYPGFAIHQALFSLLHGEIQPNAKFTETDSSSIAMSALVEDLPFPPKLVGPYSTAAQKPVRDLRRAIQDLHFNVTVGLLSLAPQLLYSENSTAEAETFLSENVWSYDAFVLLLTYAIAAVLDVLAIILGVAAMMRNGGVYGFEFARVLATTRASTALDAQLQGWEDGMDPIPQVAKKTRVMYGVVGDAGPRQRAGFGLEHEVAAIR